MTSLFSSETRRRIAIQPGELRIVLASAAWFFFVLAGYSILRPLREQMGVAGGVRNLPWLFLCTLTVMLLLNPVYGRVLSRLPRDRFVPLVYRFFMSHLLIFFGLMTLLPGDAQLWVGRAFFVWLSVFNLFVITVFWSYLVDNFGGGRARRLYAWIAVGGTLGSVLGSLLTLGLLEIAYARGAGFAEGALPYLLLPSLLCLECSVRAARHLARVLAAAATTAKDRAALERREHEEVLGGGSLDGLKQVVRSPYLLTLCLYLLCYTITGSLLYFMQAEVVAGEFATRASRTEAFTIIDIAVQLTTLLLQLFLTGRIIAVAGIGKTLSILPLTAAAAFVAIAAAPILQVVVIAQTLRRSVRYALTKPAREVLFSVVERSEKYKAKGLIDTFVYRTGDAIGGGTYALVKAASAGLSAVALVALPVTVGWTVLALGLGRMQAARAAANGDEPAAAD